MEKKKIHLERGIPIKPLDPNARAPHTPPMQDKDIERKLDFAHVHLNTFKKLKNFRMVLITEEIIKALEKGLSKPRKKN